MKKGILSLLTWGLPFLLLAQTDTSHGINWADGLSWEQVKGKAKTENKYIFIDCFTTWCGPCKMMDMQVYGNDSVGDYFNKHFISVKVQMDKTKTDNENVQRWYNDVLTISDLYHVNAYPTFIFLSPYGAIVDKQMGFKETKDFLALARNATVPGKVYLDPYGEYYGFVAEHKEGKRDYDRYPSMIALAKRLNENEFFNQLLKEFSAYVIKLPGKERYTKERIEMWNQFTFSSNSKVFHFFYDDGKFIDKVMQKKGYADKFVDKTIKSEIVDSFFKEQNKNPSIAMSGGYLTGKDLPSDNSEADWQQLEKLIREKFNSYYAKRNVLEAKVEWYNRHRNWSAFVRHALLLLDKYWTIKYDNLWAINAYSWAAFMNSTDKRIIDGYIRWMDKVVTKKPDFVNALDTYANLLYKAGRKKEAIEWEQKAMDLVPSKGKKEYKGIIDQMLNGEPTYGAVWAYK